MRKSPAVIGCLIGLGLTPVAFLLAIFSAGAGHGDYVLARAIFPIPMLTTMITNDRIDSLSIVLASLQFPIYGAVLGRPDTRGRRLAFAAVAAIHAAATAAAFSGALSAFSG